MLSEIHPTNDDEPELSSSELDKIVNEMGESWTYLMGSTGAKSLAFLFNTDRVTVKNANELTVKIFGVQYKRLSDSFPKDIFDRDPLFVWIGVLDDAGEEVDDLLLIGVHLKSGKNFRDNHLVAMAKLVTEIDKFKKKNGISRSEKDVIILGDLNDDSHRRKRFHYLFDYLEDKRFTHLGSDLDPYPGTRVNGSQIDHIFVANHLIEDWIEAESFTVHDDDDPQEYRKTFSDHFPLTFEFVIDDE